MSKIILKLSELVNSQESNEVCVEYTPQPGKKIFIETFAGEGAFNSNAAVRIAWCYDHLTEPEIIFWSIKGSNAMPFKDEIPVSEIDGIRKLALCLRNDMSSGSIYMSGYVVLRVVDV